MTKAEGAAPYLPDGGGLDALRAAVGGCRGCSLHRDAPQAVFGAGRPGARLLLAGEQPGDSEDRCGEPFVGPAGRVLDDALEAVGIDRPEVYVTNVVKHLPPAAGRRDPRGGPAGRRELPGPDARSALATIHPSAVLRTDPEQRHAAFDGLVADLRVVA